MLLQVHADYLREEEDKKGETVELEEALGLGTASKAAKPGLVEFECQNLDPEDQRSGMDSLTQGGDKRCPVEPFLLLNSNDPSAPDYERQLRALFLATIGYRYANMKKNTQNVVLLL